MEGTRPRHCIKRSKSSLKNFLHVELDLRMALSPVTFTGK
jgi:hypothetical protein